MSALGNKGEKNQGKFKAIDINNLYKGSSITPQKPAPASNRQHGLQSLGKVANIRRMPPPANLPSLKSEHGGSDSNLTTPVGSAGWTKEDSPPPSPAAAAPVAAAAAPQQKPTPQPTQTQPPDNHVQQQNQLDAAQGQGYHQQPANAFPLWSSITSDGRRPGSYLDQKSAMFREEFPQLAQGSDEKIPMGRRGDENRDAPHGHGLNLRPQNVGNWREGGGRIMERSTPSVPLPDSGGSDGVAAGDELTAGADAPRPASVGHPSQMAYRGGPMPQMMAMRPGMPPQPGQMPPMMPAGFRGMPMMPFGFRPGFPPNFPQNFIPPGMQRPPFVNPADFRFQGMYPGPPWNYMRFPGSDEQGNPPTSSAAPTPSDRPLILKKEDIEGFDRLHISDEGWAIATNDVDYSEKIVFSDEEENAAAADKSRKVASVERQLSEGSGRGSDRSRPDRDGGGSRDTGFCDRDSNQRTRREPELHERYERQQSSEAVVGSPVGPKEAWMPVGPQSFNRLPAPPAPNSDHRQWRPEMPLPIYQQPPFIQRPPFRPPLDAPVSSGSDVPAGGISLEADDDDEVWRQRRKKQSDNMSAAIERARQRREEEERRMKEERDAAAREKLRQLNEKHGKKDDKESPVDKERDRPSDVVAKTVPAGTVRISQHKSDKDLLSSEPPSEPAECHLARSPSGSPRPPLLQQQRPPDRPAGYWPPPYDVRTWGPLPSPARYMMDPRYMWHMQHAAGMPVMMPPRRPASNESAGEGRDDGQQSPDSAAGNHPPSWLDQNAYGAHPNMSGGPYDQARGYYGTMQPCYGQKEQFEYSAGHDDDLSSQPTTGSARSRSASEEDVPRVLTASDAPSAIERPNSMQTADQHHQQMGPVDPNRKSSAHNNRGGDQSSLREPDARQFGGDAASDRRAKTETDKQQQQQQQRSNAGNRAQHQQHSEPDATKHEQSEVSASSGNATTVLKRTHSSASNSSSVVSNDRRTDSPRDFGGQQADRPNAGRSGATGQLQSQRSLSKESLKSSQQNQGVKDRLSSSQPLPEDFSNLRVGNDSQMSADNKKSDSVPGNPDESTTAAAKSTRATDNSQVNGNADRPPLKRVKEGAHPYNSRKRSDYYHEPERVHVGIGSREFVRGGRGRLHAGSGRGYAGGTDEHRRMSETRSGRGGRGFRNTSSIDDGDDDYYEDDGEFELETGLTEQGHRPSAGAAANRNAAPGRPESGNLPAGDKVERKDVPPTQSGMRPEQPREPRRNDGRRNYSNRPRNDRPVTQRNDLPPDQRNEGANNISMQRQTDQQNPRGPRGPRYSRGRAPRGSPGMQSANPSSGTQQTANPSSRQPTSSDNKDSVQKPASGTGTVEHVNVSAGAAALPDSGAAAAGDKTASQRPPGSRRRRNRGPRGGRAEGNVVAGGAPGAGQSVPGHFDASSNGNNNPRPVSDGRDRRPDNRPERQRGGNGPLRSYDNNARYSDRDGRDRGPPRDSNQRNNTRVESSTAKKPATTLASLPPDSSSVTATAGTHEEWETASESSDVLRNTQPRRDRPAGTGERRDAKKSFSNQRPAAYGRRRRDRRGPAAGGESGAAGGEARPGSLNPGGNVHSLNGATGNVQSSRIDGTQSTGSNGTAHPVV